MFADISGNFPVSSELEVCFNLSNERQKGQAQSIHIYGIFYDDSQVSQMLTTFCQHSQDFTRPLFSCSLLTVLIDGLSEKVTTRLVEKQSNDDNISDNNKINGHSEQKIRGLALCENSLEMVNTDYVYGQSNSSRIMIRIISVKICRSI